MKKHLIYFFLAFSCIINAGAQETSESYTPGTWVMGVPQHLFQNGIKIEIDKRLSSPQKWIILSPSFYYRDQRGNRLFGNYDVLGLKGGGLDVLYRWYIKELNEDGGFYLSAGGGYRFISRKFSGNRWESYVENDLTYYRYDEAPWYKKTHSANVRGTAGYQFILDNHMAIDFFMGYGMKLSNEITPEDIQSYGEDDVYSFGGSGFIFVGGVRVGIGW